MAKFPTYEEMAKNIAEKALDEFLYDGKSIREWMQIIASEDCISRQEVLDILKDKWNMFSDANDAMQESIDTIEALPPVTPQEPRWIPVSEKVPEESGMYLVSGRWKNEPYEVWICEFMYLGELKGWANDAKRPIVTAWMPLPAPYEPQESESEE